MTNGRAAAADPFVFVILSAAPANEFEATDIALAFSKHLTHIETTWR